MNDSKIGPESQFFFNGDICRISHDSAAKMAAKEIDPGDVAAMVESGEVKIEPDRSYEGRQVLGGQLMNGRRVIVPYDHEEGDKMELVTVFDSRDPECTLFMTDRDVRQDRWERRKKKQIED